MHFDLQVRYFGMKHLGDPEETMEDDQKSSLGRSRIAAAVAHVVAEADLDGKLEEDDVQDGP